MYRKVLIVILVVAAFAACNSGKNAGGGSADSIKTHVAAPSAPASALNDTGTAKLVKIVNAYYTVKDALVAAKADNAQRAADSLSAAAVSLQGFLLQKEGMPGPYKPYLDTIIMECRAIAAATDKTCEQQRLAFGPMSSALYALAKSTELRHISIYHEFCPMAFNEKGATWLSNESEIKNPYFGDKMLDCGEVLDSLQ